MYCSSCATPLQVGLKYCNRCGNRITSSEEVTESNKAGIKTDKVVDHLATVICFVAIFGFGALFLIVNQLIKSGPFIGEAIAFAVMILGTILGVSWLLVRQISSVLNGNKQLEVQRAESGASVLLRDTQPQQLQAPGEVISVTEHTTRNFEAAYPERNAQ